MEKTEAQEILYEQTELFPSITEADVDRTLFLLDKFVYMKMFVQDFEDNEEEMYLADVEGETARRLSEQELHADKTANAVIAQQKRKWIYNEYKITVNGIQRSHRLIRDEDVSKVIHFRYIEGWPPMTAVKFTHMNKTTFDRKRKAGVASITDSLKLMGILQRNWIY